MEIFCPWEPAHQFIFSSNVPILLYYSHFIAVLAAVVLGIILLMKARESLVVRVFITTIFFFILWAIIDVLLWASNDPGIVLFYWGLQLLLEMLLYAVAFYFSYLFLTQTDLSLFAKILLGALVAPIILLLPTAHLLPAIDVSYCNAIETPFVIFFTYAAEILLSFLILFTCFKELHKKTARAKELVFFTLGILVFLFAFSSGNIIGSITEDWELAQYGLFGMPIFMGLLAYLIVRYKAFNVKVIGAQALVLALWVLIGSLLFVVKSDLSKIISLLTLLISVGFGLALVRSVKREVTLREELELANKRQQETLRFITHEVKGYLTDGAAALDAMLTGMFGALSTDAHTMLTEAMMKNRNALREIQNFLRIADFKTGKVSYAVEVFDFKTKLEEGLPPLAENAKNKGLSFTTDLSPGEYKVTGDSDQLINHVIGNLVNNAINYTPAGEIIVRLVRQNNKMLFSVKDSGVGLSPDDKAVLFTEGGHGKESRTVNPHSTGYGLFIAEKIVEAHHGRMWADSKGRGKGSTFFVELPLGLSPEDFKK